MVENKDYSKIYLRLAKDGDQKIINDFFDSLSGESRALFNRRDYNRKGILKHLSNPLDSRIYYIYEDEGKMAGYVFLLDYDTSVPSLGIALANDYQGKKIGEKLISFMQEKIIRENLGGLQLTTHVANIRAQALYEKMGFVCMGGCKNSTELFYLWRYRKNN